MLDAGKKNTAFPIRELVHFVTLLPELKFCFYDLFKTIKAYGLAWNASIMLWF